MYESADMSIWKGRVDEGEDSNGLRWHQAIKPPAEDIAIPGIALLGICCDEGVRRNHGRPGAAGGPDSIRRQMANLPCLPDRHLYDSGNIQCRDGSLEKLQEEQAAKIKNILNRGHFPLILGGGHEIAFGSFSGLALHLEASGSAESIGIINFDAHFDLRQAEKPNSGTPFSQIADHCLNRGAPFKYLCLGISESSNTRALFNRAVNLRAEYMTDQELRPWKLHEAEKRLAQFVRECGRLYLSIDLDVLPAATAPGVSAPAAGGLPLEILEHLLTLVTSEAGIKLRIADIAECNPLFDIDGRTARTAARLCYLLASKLEIEANHG